MRQPFPVLVAFLGLCSLVQAPAFAQEARRPARAPAPPVAQVVPQQVAQPVPPQQQPGICCCRVWSHGWQYSWRSAPECSAQNGTCVSPDHC